MSTLLLCKSDMAGLLNMEEVMAVVAEVFRDHALGKAHMPPKVYIELEKGDFRAMPGSVADAVGVKWINVHPANRELGLPTVMGILICSDPDTAYPIAIMDATDITAYRTAATSANATKSLARSNSRTLGLIGAGRQAYTHLESHALIMPLDTVKVYDVRPEAVEAFIRHFPEVNVKAVSAEEAAASDVVCTLTPATAPVIEASWVLPGTHINAVGADAEGKHELDPGLLEMARVVVDDMGQACHCGEINVALCRGVFTEAQVWGTLGEIMVGTKSGRQDDQTITIFDSTGLAIEDIATGRMIYQKAKKRGGYLSVNIV